MLISLNLGWEYFVDWDYGAEFGFTSGSYFHVLPNKILYIFSWSFRGYTDNINFGQSPDKNRLENFQDFFFSEPPRAKLSHSVFLLPPAVEASVLLFIQWGVQIKGFSDSLGLMCRFLKPQACLFVSVHIFQTQSYRHNAAVSVMPFVNEKCQCLLVLDCVLSTWLAPGNFPLYPSDYPHS